MLYLNNFELAMWSSHFVHASGYTEVNFLMTLMFEWDSQAIQVSNWGIMSRQRSKDPRTHPACFQPTEKWAVCRFALGMKMYWWDCFSIRLAREEFVSCLQITRPNSSSAHSLRLNVKYDVASRETNARVKGPSFRERSKAIGWAAVGRVLKYNSWKGEAVLSISRCKNNKKKTKVTTMSARSTWKIQSKHTGSLG